MTKTLQTNEKEVEFHFGGTGEIFKLFNKHAQILRVSKILFTLNYFLTCIADGQKKSLIK